MKRKRLMMAALLCCLSVVVNARTWTIGTGGDFVDFNAAMSSSSVVDGDELLVLPGSILSGTQIISKSVSIMGNGYDMESGTLSSSAQLQGSLQLMSDGIKVSSFVLNKWPASSPGSYYTASLYIYASDVIVEKCLIHGYIRSSQYYDTENTIIRQCFISSAILANGASGWTVSNNIIACEYGSTSYNYYILSNLHDSVIDHNIICSLFDSGLDVMTYCIYNVTSSTITNNILVHFQWNKQLEGTADGIITEECLLNNTVKNNVFTGDAPNSNNRGGIYATTDIFDCGSTISLWSFYRSDTYLKLVPNSPAAGYATDGGDCGPWSGASPYVVGGITSATEPMTGNYKLDLNATDNPSNGVFQSLLSLFTAMGTNGIGSQMNVSVADGVYNYVINEATYAVLQAMGAQVIASTGAISMAAASSATFNFTVDTSFLLAHSSEISNITAIFNTIKERISLTHITVLFNGTPVIFDEFQVEANDLLALKNMYQAWGGDNWTTKRWNFENNGRNKDDFPGVTFDENGRVTAIDLENNNLVGECFNVYSPQLSELTSLNLSRNKLEGDLGLLVNGMAKMKYLNLSYNRLNCISKDLQFAEEFSSTIDIRYQNRKYLEGSPMKADFTENIDTMPAMKVLLSREMYFTVPSLFTYDFKYQAHRLNPPLCVRQITPPALDFATLTYNGSNYGDNGKSYTLNYSGLYSLPQDQRMVLVDEWSSYVRYSALPVIFHYEVGDADMNGTTNVLDVQYTLNYVLAPSTISYFNYSAANTYTDQQINVQDIVKTVNIILDQPQPDYQFSRRAATVPDVSTSDEGIVSIADCRVIVSTQRDVSAIDIELEGITIDQVGLMLNQRDFQMIGRNTEWGCRFIIFSPTGKHITAGTDTALLRLSAQATVVGIQCSDPYAQKVMMTIGTTPTGIKETTKEKATDNAIYNLNGHRLTDGDMIKKGIYVRQGQKFIVR